MDSVMEKIREINRRNNQLKRMYNSDEKFARAHKRIVERGLISKRESEVCDTLNSIKHTVDEKVLLNSGVLKNDPYFEQTVKQLISVGLLNLNIRATVDEKQFITTKIAGEYLLQYHNQQNGYDSQLLGSQYHLAAERAAVTGLQNNKQNYDNKHRNTNKKIN
jgi:type I restriction enzyme R subunit